MSRAENDAYWGSTDTAPSALDTFFDEDSDVNWTGYSYSSSSLDALSTGSGSTGRAGGGNQTSPTKQQSPSSISSIADNISQSPEWVIVNSTSGSSGRHFEFDSGQGSSGRLAKGVEKAIGVKLDSWKPPSMPFKWNSSAGQGNGMCPHCSAKDEKIADLRKRLDHSFSRYNLTLPPEDTVNRIILGRPYTLECYRSHEDKLALVDYAIGTMDGSAILATVLHLRNTVKKTLFIQEMQSRPHAAQLYVSYLKQRHSNKEALDFLSSLEKHDDAAILSYKIAISSKNAANMVRTMKDVVQTNFTHSSLSHEGKMVKDHIKLLERQILIDEADSKAQTSNPMLIEYPRAASIEDKALLTTLYYCCMYHWDASESHCASPVALRKAHNIPDHQVLWTVIRGRARVNHWPLPADLDSWMGNKGLIGALGSLTSAFSGAGKVVKSKLPLEQVVHVLSSHGAPSNVLAAYIALIDSPDTRLKLAVNYRCHQAVIDVHVSQKDRDALEKYLKEISPDSPEYVKATNALKTVKWKN